MHHKGKLSLGKSNAQAHAWCTVNVPYFLLVLHSVRNSSVISSVISSLLAYSPLTPHTTLPLPEMAETHNSLGLRALSPEGQPQNAASLMGKSTLRCMLQQRTNAPNETGTAGKLKLGVLVQIPVIGGSLASPFGARVRALGPMSISHSSRGGASGVAAGLTLLLPLSFQTQAQLLAGLRGLLSPAADTPRGLEG